MQHRFKKRGTGAAFILCRTWYFAGNLDGEFTASAFVSQVTGVDNVCERSAMAGSQNGKILISKMAKNGVTAAFVLDEVKISF